MRAALVFAALVLAMPAVALAQSAITSTDDIIRQFRPTAGGPGRGIRSVPAPVTAGPDTASQAHPNRAGPFRSGAGHAAATRAHPAPVALAISAAEPSRPGDLAALNMQVQFAFGSDQLTPQAARTLTVLGQALADQQLTGLNFRIEGHTDAIGGPALNEALSLRRANAVVDFITRRHGVDRARLTPVGLGETQPLVPTGEGAAEPRNRRVMVVSTGS